MPTCRDIVTYALRLGKVVAVGAQPTATEAGMGLVALQSMYLDLAANGMFGQLLDVATSANYAANPGERVRAEAAVTVTCPTSIRGPCGYRPPYDLSLIETLYTIAGTRSLRLYEAGRGAWVELVDVGLDSEAPLASRGALGLAATLASYGGFTAMFASQLDPTLQPLVRTFRAGLIGRMGGDRAPAQDEYA